MKKSINAYIFSLTTLTLVSCHSPHTLTYQEGLDRCSEHAKKKQEEHPGRFYFEGPDCIVGSMLPEFKGQTFDGQIIDHQYFAGKITLINFWFETCAPCVAEIPILDSLIDKYGKEKFNYLAIGRDTEDDIVAFLKDHPWRFDQVKDGANIYDIIFEKPWGYPTTFVADEKGIIIAAFAGLNGERELELESVLDRITNNE